MKSHDERFLPSQPDYGISGKMIAALIALPVVAVGVGVWVVFRSTSSAVNFSSAAKPLTIQPSLAATKPSVTLPASARSPVILSTQASTLPVPIPRIGSIAGAAWLTRNDGSSSVLRGLHIQILHTKLPGWVVVAMLEHNAKVIETEADRWYPPLSPTRAPTVAATQSPSTRPTTTQPTLAEALVEEQNVVAAVLSRIAGDEQYKRAKATLVSMKEKLDEARQSGTPQQKLDASHDFIIANQAVKTIEARAIAADARVAQARKQVQEARANAEAADSSGQAEETSKPKPQPPFVSFDPSDSYRKTMADENEKMRAPAGIAREFERGVPQVMDLAPAYVLVRKTTFKFGHPDFGPGVHESLMTDVKADIDGKYRIGNIAVGTYYVHALIESETLFVEWIVPVQIEAERELKVDLDNDNAVCIIDYGRH